MNRMRSTCVVGFCALAMVVFASAVAAAQQSEASRKALESAAAKGSAPAQYALGAAAEVDGDSTRAASWYRRAAENGYAAAQFKLGELLESGKGVSPDAAEALEWYRKSAAQDFAAAKSRLEVLDPASVLSHTQEHPTAVDATRQSEASRKALESAAAKGSAPAQYALGAGAEANGDFKRAASWYRQAADNGYAAAQFKLGQFLEGGQGLAPDPTQAVQWYRKAAAQDFANARSRLQVLDPSALAQERPDPQTDSGRTASGSMMDGLITLATLAVVLALWLFARERRGTISGSRLDYEQGAPERSTTSVRDDAGHRESSPASSYAGYAYHATQTRMDEKREHKQQTLEAATKEVVIRRYNGGRPEWDWDGKTLRRYNGGHPEWNWDGKTLRRYNGGRPEWDWDGKTLRRYNGGYPEWNWDGKTLSRYNGGHPEWEFDGKTLRRYNGGHPEWECDGDVPIPVLAAAAGILDSSPQEGTATVARHQASIKRYGSGTEWTFDGKNLNRYGSGTEWTFDGKNLIRCGGGTKWTFDGKNLNRYGGGTEWTFDGKNLNRYGGGTEWTFDGKNLKRYGRGTEWEVDGVVPIPVLAVAAGILSS